MTVSVHLCNNGGLCSKFKQLLLGILCIDVDSRSTSAMVLSHDLCSTRLNAEPLSNVKNLCTSGRYALPLLMSNQFFISTHKSLCNLKEMFSNSSSILIHHQAWIM